jgi:hypothetical protein
MQSRSALITGVFDLILTLTGKSKEAVVRITSKGQVTIPQEIREKAGLLPHTEVDQLMALTRR